VKCAWPSALQRGQTYAIACDFSMTGDYAGPVTATCNYGPSGGTSCPANPASFHLAEGAPTTVTVNVPVPGDALEGPFPIQVSGIDALGRTVAPPNSAFMPLWLPHPNPGADYSAFCENTDVRLSNQVRQAQVTCHIRSRSFSGRLRVQVDSPMAFTPTEFVSITSYSSQQFVVTLGSEPPGSYEAIVRVTPADHQEGQASRDPDSIIRVTFVG
jgi:hypothetical protein